MRLLVISARYPTPDRPAAGQFVRDRLADPGLAATVVAPRRYDRPGWLRYLSLTWRALTAGGAFDGVEGHFVLPSGAVALLVARLRGLPLVVYAHGGDVRVMARRNALLAWLARRVVRGADAVATNSDGTAALVRELGTDAVVIPPGIDLSRFHPAPRPMERRVLYLGGDVPHKGVALARRLADTLAGPGLREVAPEEVPGLLAAHDVLLVPSLDEPFGLVAAEAIASGRWVVARSVGGLREIVSDGVNGTLRETDADLEAALSRIPDYDPQVVAATAERFSVERHRAGMAALWERVLAARRARS
ncbi:MAG TPA: glycosyltransferase [Candidatus Limnocylindria bacterium]|nr:glycosyltransferase [Candidatus Limnocylindria bacterium]